ncbi:proteasome component domain-containing protein [Tanacetum coccineum]
MAALEYLDSLRTSHPELSEWYNTLADLYQRKLWHQLTLKLEQFVALAVFQAGDALIQLYHNFITDFETKINLLKLAHFAVIVSRQYSEKEAAISYLDGVIEKLRATKESRIEEPILYIKMQIAVFNLEKGDQKGCKNLLDDGKTTLDSMTDIDPSVYATYYWVSSQYHNLQECSSLSGIHFSCIPIRFMILLLIYLYLHCWERTSTWVSYFAHANSEAFGKDQHSLLDGNYLQSRAIRRGNSTKATTPRAFIAERTKLTSLKMLNTFSMKRVLSVIVDILLINTLIALYTTNAAT